MVQAPGRRDRVRAATVTEIKQTARQILVAQGVEGLSLRAIAREMGMTAPALYRYFPSREDLLEHLIADLYDEVSDAMEAARDRLPADDTAGRLLAVSRTFRRWSVEHPAEFTLIFASPLPGVLGQQDERSVTHRAGLRFGGIFGDLVARVYRAKPFPIVPEDEMDPRLRRQLADWASGLLGSLPLGVVQVFLSCWIRLYGTVTMEVFHLKLALIDAEPMFESQLRGLGELLGIGDAYRPPAAAPTAAAPSGPAPAAR
jgi:AcrR family transcriptional regulator